MLSTTENVLYLGHNQLLTTSADDPTQYYYPSTSKDNSQNKYLYNYLHLFTELLHEDLVNHQNIHCICSNDWKEIVMQQLCK